MNRILVLFLNGQKEKIYIYETVVIEISTLPPTKEYYVELRTVQGKLTKLMLWKTEENVSIQNLFGL